METADQAIATNDQSPVGRLVTSLRRVYEGLLLTAPDDMSAYLTDWRGKWHGDAIAVAVPGTVDEVARVVRWCGEHAVAVVPQGGNTGLSGGSVPERGSRALVLSTRRLNRVRAMDLDGLTMTVEAGCLLEVVQTTAREAGLLFPLSLAAEGSCTIGGNLATNAGGVQVLRFGNARDLCLGLEVVTPDGMIWHGLTGLRKDNSGYDLKDLYIGSEGTLGVITAAVLKLFVQPAGRGVAFIGLATPVAAVALLTLARQQLGEGLTAFELVSAEALRLVLAQFPDSRSPLPSATPWYVLIESCSHTSDEAAHQVLEKLLELAFERELIADAALAASIAQADALWALRENVSEAQAAHGTAIKHDIALPTAAIPSFIETVGASLRDRFPGATLITFGHLGDGNLHYNLSPSADRGDAQAQAAFGLLEGPINRLVHDAVSAMGGSISAEHGLGVLRRDEAARYKSPIALSLMHAIKTALDPRGLMNPMKVLLPADRDATGVSPGSLRHHAEDTTHG